MKLNLISYIMALPVIIAGCTQSDILYEAEYNVTLNPENTYIAGEPVTFDISGDIDNLLFYSGENGHKYHNRDRLVISVDEIESAAVYLRILPQYGNTNGGLHVYMSNSFEGLKLNDGQADRAAVKAMVDGGMQGWKDVTSNIWPDTNPEKSGVEVKATIPIESIENFCLAFHWNPTNLSDVQRSYRIYPDSKVILNTKQDGTLEFPLTDYLLFNSVMMNEEIEDPYRKNDGNGTIIFTSEDYAINFQGVSAGVLTYCVDGWVFSTPQDLTSVPSDSPELVKDLQNYLYTYSYTYNEPGTYEAVFYGVNANYIGSSSKVVSIPVTILDRPLDGGNDGDGVDETDPETPAE